jgi:hypothetical protein
MPPPVDQARTNHDASLTVIADFHRIDAGRLVPGARADLGQAAPPARRGRYKDQQRRP